MFCVKIEFITYSTNPVPQLSSEHFVPNADKFMNCYKDHMEKRKK